MSVWRAAALVAGLSTAVPWTAALSAPEPRAAALFAVQTKAKKRPTGIEWKVTPGSVEIFVDGKRLGTARELNRTRHRPGRHTIVLRRGGDEEEFEVRLIKGLTLRLEYSFGN